MSSTHGPDSRDRELERLLEQARRPAATAAFRARLRDEFLSSPGTATEPVPADGRPTSEPRRVQPRSRIFPFVWPLVVAASIAFLIHFVLSRDANLRWRVIGVGGGGEFIVDGRKIHSSEGTRLQDALQTAREIETFEAGLRLQLADEIVVELGPKTRVSQLSFPPAQSYSAYTNTGSLRMTTGPGYANRMRVLTDTLEMVVVGTTFGVDVEEAGTCLCCTSGMVKCDARDGRGMLPVEAGHMCFAFRSGQKPLWGDVARHHAEPLEKLASFANSAWKSAK